MKIFDKYILWWGWDGIKWNGMEWDGIELTN